MRTYHPLLLALLLHGPAALAQTAPVPQVKVDATRDPVDKSYRKMLQGVDRFERDHALAPQAVLRFRLLPRQPGVDMTGVRLRIAGDTVSIPCHWPRTTALPRCAMRKRRAKTPC